MLIRIFSIDELHKNKYMEINKINTIGRAIWKICTI